MTEGIGTPTQDQKRSQMTCGWTTNSQNCAICSTFKVHYNDQFGSIFTIKTVGTRENDEKHEQQKERTTVGSWLEKPLMGMNHTVQWSEQCRPVFVLVGFRRSLGDIFGTPTPLTYSTKVRLRGACFAFLLTRHSKYTQTRHYISENKISSIKSRILRLEIQSLVSLVEGFFINMSIFQSNRLSTKLCK